MHMPRNGGKEPRDGFRSFYFINKKRGMRPAPDKAAPVSGSEKSADPV